MVYDVIAFGCAARIAELEKCFNTNTDEYFIAKKVGLDTAETKPSKIFGKQNLPAGAAALSRSLPGTLALPGAVRGDPPARRCHRRRSAAPRMVRRDAGLRLF